MIEKKLNNFNNVVKSQADFEQFSDKDLYEYCKKVGYNARIWYRRFIATIPEVAKRRLYKKYGYCSIYEFAGKLAGVSHKNTDEVLRINEKFEEMPNMKKLIGEIGLSKLKVVACIVTKDTDGFWAEKVKNLTKSSLEIYVREMKKNDSQGRIVAKFPGELIDINPQISQLEEQIGMFDLEMPRSQISNNAIFENVQNNDKRTFSIQIDEETEFELRKFKLQLEKERKEPVDWNFALKEMVKRSTSEQKVLQKQTNWEFSSASGSRTKPEIIAPKLKDVEDVGTSKQKSVSRYIPAKIRQDLQQKYNRHCAFNGCNKPAEQIHHPERFAHSANHENLIPLCKNHHNFVHQCSSEKQNIEVDKIFNTYKMKYCP